MWKRGIREIKAAGLSDQVDGREKEGGKDGFLCSRL